MHVLEVRHLEIVAAIAETGSVARAADVLHLSQPALSHALRTLEDRLGVRLFERARRMSPTPAGLELQEAGRSILALVRQAEQRVSRYANGSGGVVRIATECYTCYHWLPTVIQRLRATVPDVSVRIVGEATTRALQALLNGELDLALLHFKPSLRRVVCEKLFNDEQILITAPDHPLAKRPYVVPADFAGERLLAHRDPERSAFWKTFLEPAGVRPLERTSLLLTEALVESVKAGLGVAVLARWAVANELAAKELAAVRIGRHGLRRSWYAATLRGRNDPSTTALLDVLRTGAIRAVRGVPGHARSIAAAAERKIMRRG
jgi:LysR family transcriptional regulator for metE and metH